MRTIRNSCEPILVALWLGGVVAALVVGPWWLAAASRRLDALVEQVREDRDDARLAEQREWIERRLRLRGMVAPPDVYNGVRLESGEPVLDGAVVENHQPSPREAGQ